MGSRRGVDLSCMHRRLDVAYSHDNFYHTVVGLVDVATPTYSAALDAFAPCRKAGS